MPGPGPGGGISGINGDVLIEEDQLQEVRKWSFKPTQNNPSYGSNRTGGYKKRVPGIKDATGSIGIAYIPGNPVYGVSAGQIREGSQPELALYIDDYHYIDAPAIIDSMSFEVDLDEGSIVTCDAEFSANGLWTANFVEQSSSSSSSLTSSSGSSSSSSS